MKWIEYEEDRSGNSSSYMSEEIMILGSARAIKDFGRGIEEIVKNFTNFEIFLMFQLNLLIDII